ncbi:hypothetical protein R69888_02728 [Paraburkholderia haematera]|uniref:Uncharacterized protein n=1 Tax=Paraburkholderia haematera TaxID=2793077 RepID=A0ABN7LK54_9BURK|nr:hypothetical protein R69888_02728 [Paraburkholderia haematera]
MPAVTQGRRDQRRKFSIQLRQPLAGVTSFRPAGVYQTERAVVAGLAHDVEGAAASRVCLLRAGVGARWTLNQRSQAAVRQKQRCTAAATAQHGDCGKRQHGTGTAREREETAFHLKPRSHLVFRSRDCATRPLHCVIRCRRTLSHFDAVCRDLLIKRRAAHADLHGCLDHATAVGAQGVAQVALFERGHSVAPRHRLGCLRFR